MSEALKKPPISIEVRPVVSYYGIYIDGELSGELIFNSRSNAELIRQIMINDYYHLTDNRAEHIKELNNIIEEGDYILGYEQYGFDNRIRPMVGWVHNKVIDTHGNIKGYSIRCDDTFGGARENYVMYEYGNIVKLPNR